MRSATSSIVVIVVVIVVIIVIVFVIVIVIVIVIIVKRCPQCSNCVDMYSMFELIIFDPPISNCSIAQYLGALDDYHIPMLHIPSSIFLQFRISSAEMKPPIFIDANLFQS